MHWLCRLHCFYLVSSFSFSFSISPVIVWGIIFSRLSTLRVVPNNTFAWVMKRLRSNRKRTGQLDSKEAIYPTHTLLSTPTIEEDD